jgi:hypothetical protein
MYTAKQDDVIVLTHGADATHIAAGTGITKLLRVNSLIPDRMPLTGTLRFLDVSTGATISAVYSGLTTRSPGVGVISVGGYSYDFWVTRTSAVGKDRVNLLVDLDDDGVPGGEAKIITQGGAIIDLGEQTASVYNAPIAGNNLALTLETLPEQFDEASARSEFIFVNLTGTGGIVDAEYYSAGVAEYIIEPGVYGTLPITMQSMTTYGAKITENAVVGADTISVDYPIAQLLPQVYVTFEKECPTQCNDGIDNDGDGRIDMADIGCSNVTDNDETNPRPLIAKKTAKKKIEPVSKSLPKPKALK